MQPGPRRPARHRHRPESGRHTERGLVTLEWLLLVGAIAGLAASSVLVVQRVLDDSAELPADPAVRVIDADIAAAFLAREADAAALDGVIDFADYQQRCWNLRAAFDDVVAFVAWTSPTTTPAPASLDRHALCKVTLQAGLGG